MENGTVMVDLPMNTVIFHRYANFPEGINDIWLSKFCQQTLRVDEYVCFSLFVVTFFCRDCHNQLGWEIILESSNVSYLLN